MKEGYELRVSDDPSRWDRLVDKSPDGYFSQLWGWGEIQRSVGWEPWRLELLPIPSAGSSPIAAAQVLVRRPLGIGWGIAYAPRGPMLGRGEVEWARFTAALTNWAGENRIATIMFDPNVGPESELGRAMMRPPWKAARQLGEPRCHVVDLLPEAALWANVRRKHRESIRRAERANVDLVWTDGRARLADADIAMDHFQKVQREIAHRIGVPLTSPNYYRLMWDTFGTAGRAHLVTATKDGKPVGAMLHLTCGNDMLWFAGGQTAEGARLGISKLLVWRSMVRAGELGVRRYNMWGTATEGLAHFKLGFGAREENYVGTRSMAINGAVDRLFRAALRARQIGRHLRRH